MKTISVSLFLLILLLVASFHDAESGPVRGTPAATTKETNTHKKTEAKVGGDAEGHKAIGFIDNRLKMKGK